MTYTRREWLNPEWSSFTGSVVGWLGIHETDGAVRYESVFEVADCHQKVRLHQRLETEGERRAFVHKMRLLAEVANELADNVEQVGIPLRMEQAPTPDVECAPEWGVWAIEHQTRERDGTPNVWTVAVSAESDIGAVKRLQGNRECAILRVERIPGREPKWKERRIEGTANFVFSPDTPRWDAT